VGRGICKWRHQASATLVQCCPSSAAWSDTARPPSFLPPSLLLLPACLPACLTDRYRAQVADVLRERTVAADAPALEYLAAAAALQQFKQASLAYVLGMGTAGDNGSGSNSEVRNAVSPAVRAREGSALGQPETWAAAGGGRGECQDGAGADALREDGRMNGRGSTCGHLAATVERLLREQCSMKVRAQLARQRTVLALAFQRRLYLGPYHYHGAWLSGKAERGVRQPCSVSFLCTTCVETPRYWVFAVIRASMAVGKLATLAAPQ
jgi:hypothetical protein